MPDTDRETDGPEPGARSSAAPSPRALAETLERHQIELPSEQIECLDRYAQLLWEWNSRLNLTRHTNYEKFVTRDVIDSLWLERYLDAGERVLDVGTGGGVPGVILAIVRPDLDVTLCDSVAKKARAAAEIVAALKLPLRVLHAPAQSIVQTESFETLVTRAVAPLSKLLTWFAPHWESFERLLLIKGPNWTAERDAAREKKLLRHVRLTQLASYPLPGAESESVVLQIRPV